MPDLYLPKRWVLLARPQERTDTMQGSPSDDQPRSPYHLTPTPAIHSPIHFSKQGCV